MIMQNQNMDKRQNYVTWIQMEGIYIDIAKNVETRLKDHYLKDKKNKKVIGFMKDELGWKIMGEYRYSYL